MNDNNYPAFGRFLRSYKTQIGMIKIDPDAAPPISNCC